MTTEPEFINWSNTDSQGQGHRFWIHDKSHVTRSKYEFRRTTEDDFDDRLESTSVSVNSPTDAITCCLPTRTETPPRVIDYGRRPAYTVCVTVLRVCVTVQSAWQFCGRRWERKNGLNQCRAWQGVHRRRGAWRNVRYVMVHGNYVARDYRSPHKATIRSRLVARLDLIQCYATSRAHC